MGRLLLLFVVLPAAELALLIEVGSRIGTLPTLALIAVTGIVGASLARQQGLGVMRAIQRETEAGRMPAGTLVDGVIILIAGALLVTPGILTDVVGFLALVPGVRTLVKRDIVRRLERAAREGRVEVHLYSQDPRDPFGVREEREVRDVRDVGPGPDPRA